MTLRRFFTYNTSYPATEYIGRDGELFYDSDDLRLRVSDGITKGGIISDDVIAADARLPENWLLVETLEDLPDPSGDEVILPENTTVILANQNLNLGSDALRLQEGTLLRGLGGDMISSTNTNGIIRATNINSAVVLREFSVLSLGGGPALDLSGTTDHQLNLFFMGFFGADAGYIHGFDVQGVKSCLFNSADGIKLGGATNKVFVEGCPFYGITTGNAAITLQADLNANVADIVTNFFKYNDGIGVRAEEGYQVGEGIFRGTLIDGSAIPLEGLNPSDNNWIMSLNSGIRSSRFAGQVYLSESAITPISAVGEFVRVEGNFVEDELSERFSLNGVNQMVYEGNIPISANFVSTFTVEPEANDRLAFRVAVNDTPLVKSEIILEQGQGAGSAPRTGTVNAFIALEPGDSVSLFVANLTDTDDVEWLTANYSIFGVG